MREEPAHFVASFDFSSARLRTNRDAVSRDGLVMLLHGYIQNRASLRSTLGTAADVGDEELMAAVWKRWGQDLPAHVLGSFCGIAVDLLHRTVHAFQDALGTRSCFYSCHAGRILLASRLADVVASVDSAIVDDDYFAAWLRFGYGATEHTPYKNIHRLTGGQAISFDGLRQQTHRPWRPRLGASNGSRDRAEAIVQMLQLVEQAVDVTVDGLDNPLYELSGGLDSGTVVSMACQSGRTPQTLTWASEYDDDRAYARRLASEFGLSSVEVHCDGGAPLILDRDVSSFRSEPANELAVGLQEAVLPYLHRRAPVVITGVGGDNVFHSLGTPPLWLGDLLLSGQWVSAARIARASRHSALAQRSTLGYLWTYGVVPVWRSVFKGPATAWDPQTFGGDFLERCRALLPSTDLGADSHRPGLCSYWRGVRQLVANRVATDHMLCYSHRHPLLYLPLVEFAAGVLGCHVPTLVMDRPLQREGFAGVVPEYILTRRSKGGSVRRDVDLINSAAFRNYLGSRTPLIVARGIVNAQAWRDTLARAGHGRFSSLREFDFMLKTELWLRHAEVRMSSVTRVPLGVVFDGASIGEPPARI